MLYATLSNEGNTKHTILVVPIKPVFTPCAHHHLRDSPIATQRGVSGSDFLFVSAIIAKRIHDIDHKLSARIEHVHATRAIWSERTPRWTLTYGQCVRAMCAYPKKLQHGPDRCMQMYVRACRKVISKRIRRNWFREGNWLLCEARFSTEQHPVWWALNLRRPQRPQSCAH